MRLIRAGDVEKNPGPEFRTPPEPELDNETPELID